MSGQTSPLFDHPRPLPTWLTPFASYVQQRGNVKLIRANDKENDQGIAFVVNKCEFHLPEINPHQAHPQQDLHKELTRQQAFLQSVQAKLDNPHFLNHAPDHVVAHERKKQQDAKERIKALQQRLHHTEK